MWVSENAVCLHVSHDQEIWRLNRREGGKEGGREGGREGGSEREPSEDVVWRVSEDMRVIVARLFRFHQVSRDEAVGIGGRPAAREISIRNQTVDAKPSSLQ